MPLPGDQVPPNIDFIARELADIRRELNELRAARTLQAASVGAGGITINDDGSFTIVSADGLRRLVISNSVVAFYPNWTTQPEQRLLLQSSDIGYAQIGFHDADHPYGGPLVEFRPDGLELKAQTAYGEDNSGMQWLSINTFGGFAGIGSFGNFIDSKGAWMVDRVTGLNSGNTTVNYGVTYDTLPYPFVQVVAPAAVAWVVTSYTTSGFTVNVASGPAAGTVSILYWMVRPNIVS